MLGLARESDDPPASASQVAIQKYKLTNDNVEDGPSKERFLPDLITPSRGDSPWNARLFEIFMVDYFQNGNPTCEVKTLSKYFRTYLCSLQEKRRKMTTSFEGSTQYEVHKHRTRVEQCKQTVTSVHFVVINVLTQLPAFRKPNECFALL